MIPGYEVVEGNSAGSFTGGGGLKLLLHTTEGTSIAGAIAAYKKSGSLGSWPHFTYDPNIDRIVQHLEVTVAARSLSNDTSDGYQTNRANVVQIEIVGFAKDAGGWGDDILQKIANRLAQIRLYHQFPLIAAPFGVPAVRMSDKGFKDFAGILGHEHAPDNDHWDPGALNVNRIIQLLGGIAAPLPNPTPVPTPSRPFPLPKGHYFGKYNKNDKYNHSGYGGGVDAQNVVLIQRVIGTYADGKFGDASRNALINWQRAHGLLADGLEGAITWGRMF